MSSTSQPPLGQLGNNVSTTRCVWGSGGRTTTTSTSTGEALGSRSCDASTAAGAEGVARATSRARTSLACDVRTPGGPCPQYSHNATASATATGSLSSTVVWQPVAGVGRVTTLEVAVAGPRSRWLGAITTRATRTTRITA